MNTSSNYLKWMTTILTIMMLSTVSPTVGMPDLYIQTSQDTEINLHELSDEVFMFMAMVTSCDSCKLQNEYNKEVYQATTSFTMISISVDPDHDTVERIQQYKQTEAIPWIVAIDTTGEVQVYYKINSYPQIFLINKDGSTIKHWIGVTPAADIKQELSQYVEVDNIENDQLSLLLQSNQTLLLWVGSFLTVPLIYLFIRYLKSFYKMRINRGKTSTDL